MQNFILKFVPRAQWDTFPKQNWVGFVYDEFNVLGAWNGTKYNIITVRN